MQPDARASSPHRFWRSDRLDVRLAQRRLDASQLAGLARALAALHAEPAQPTEPVPSPAARAAAARAVVAEQAPALGGAARGCEACLAEALAACGDLLDRRARPPLARRLHGRLCCEEIHVDPRGRTQLGPPATGAAGDPCEDLAVLAVAFVACGAPDTARALIGAYAEAAGDYALYRVLDAHLALAGLAGAARALGAGGDRDAAHARAERLLAAPALLAPPAGPPFVLAVAGSIASGKTTLARQLAAAHGAPAISADAARPEGLAALEPDARDAAYAELFARAGEVLASGRPVVLDACFPTRALRAALRAFTERCGAPLLVVECRVDAANARRRLEERAAAQGRPAADWLALRAQLQAEWEPIRELPRAEHLTIDTTQEEADVHLPRIAQALARRIGGPHRVRRSPAPPFARARTPVAPGGRP